MQGKLLMLHPQEFVLYAPRGPGIMCALFYFVDHRDIYGWYVGSCNGEFPARYFKLDHYFDPADTRFLVSTANDLSSKWTRRWGAKEYAFPGCPVPEAVRPDLKAVQQRFATEWLFFAEDANAAPDIEAYAARELSVQPVNIRAAMLGKLHTGAALWRYASHSFDRNILEYLQEHWTLDHRAELL